MYWMGGAYEKVQCTLASPALLDEVAIDTLTHIRYNECLVNYALLRCA